MNDPTPPRSRPSLRVELNGRTIFFGLAAIAGVWLYLKLWPILLVVVVALMMVGTLSPFVAKLEHRGVRRGRAIAIVFVGLFLGAGLFGVLTVPRLASQISEMVERLPETQAQLAHHLEGTKLGAPLAKSLRETKATEAVAAVGRIGLAYSARVLEFTAYGITALFLALYLILDRDRMRGGAFALIPRGYHVRASRVLLNLETIVGGYMRGQMITSVLIALFTFAVLMIARVPNALSLSLFAGVVDVLPYVGALLACGPAFLAALTRGTTVAIVVLIVLALYQEFESRFIVPRIYGKVLRLPAAIVMIALLIGGKLLGIVGALLALPIAAGIRMIVEELRVALPGEDVPDAVLRERDKAEEQDFERRAEGAPAVEAAAIASEIARARIEHDAADAADAAGVPLTSGKPNSR